MNELQIRSMKISDVEAVLEIERESGLSPWSLNGYLDELKRADSILKIAVCDNKTAGFIITRLITTVEFDGEAEILNLAVKKNMRGRGIGKKLLSAVFEIAAAKSVNRIWLEVRESNASAQKFYRANSFEIVGRRKNFYRAPAEDALLMKADL